MKSPAVLAGSGIAASLARVRTWLNVRLAREVVTRDPFWSYRTHHFPATVESTQCWAAMGEPEIRSTPGGMATLFG